MDVCLRRVQHRWTRSGPSIVRKNLCKIPLNPPFSKGEILISSLRAALSHRRSGWQREAGRDFQNVEVLQTDLFYPTQWRSAIRLTRRTRHLSRGPEGLTWRQTLCRLEGKATVEGQMGRQKAEGTRRQAEDRRHRTENRSQKSEANNEIFDP